MKLRKIMAMALAVVLTFSTFASSIPALAADEAAKTTRIEAENVPFFGWTKVGGGKLDGGNTGRVKWAFPEGDATNGIDVNFDKSGIDFVQFAVNAEKAGKYEIKFAFSMGKWQDGLTAEDETFSAIIVNGKKGYKAVMPYEHTGDSQTQAIPVTVELEKGLNIITCTGITKGQAAHTYDHWLQYDYIEIGEGLTDATSTFTTIQAGDKSYSEWNKYKYENPNQNGKSTPFALGGATLPEAGAEITKDTIANVSWFKINVVAPADGLYDMTLVGNTGDASDSESMVVLVDGVAKTFSFTTPGWKGSCNYYRVNTSMELTKGEHELIFVGKFKSAKNSWGNVQELTMGNGLKPVQVRAVAGNYPYFGWTKVNASGQTSVLDGGKTDKQTQSFEQMAEKFDRAGADYVSYFVEAEEAGKYNVKLAFNIGSSDASKLTADPYVAVLVNGKAYKAVMPKDKVNSVTEVEVELELAKGVNEIICTGLTTDQEAYELNNLTDGAVWHWVQHESLTVGEGLRYAKPNYAIIDAAGTDYTVFNNYVASGSSLGSGKFDYLKENQITFDKVDTEVLKNIPWVATKVNAPADGTYNVQLKIGTGIADGSLALLVDGIKQEVTFDTAKGNGTIVVPVELKAGNHTLLLTAMLYKEGADLSKFWMDYKNIILLDGLTAVAGITEEEVGVLKVPMTRFEAEEYAMVNMAKVTAESIASAGRHIGSTRDKRFQSAEDVMANGFDVTRLPYVQFQITASEAGEYVLTTGLSQGIWIQDGETSVSYDDFNEVYTIVEVNGERQQYTRSFNGKKDTAIVEQELKVNLKEGVNTVKITLRTAETIRQRANKDGSYTVYATAWSNFDYIDVPEEDAAKLSFLKVGPTLEAENATLQDYTRTMDDGYSGGYKVGGANYEAVKKGGYTFDKLTRENIQNLSYVKYTIKAEKAGKYTIALGITSGSESGQWTDKELYDNGIWFAMQVNDGDPQKITYAGTTWDAFVSRLVEVELKEGVNTILLTCPTAEFFDYKELNPALEVDKKEYWMDYDCIVLPEGLSEDKQTSGPTGGGDIDDDPILPPDNGGDKPGDDKPGDKPGDDKPGDKPGDDKPGDTKPGDTKPGDPKPADSSSGSTVAIVIVVVVVCAAAAVAVVLIRKKNSK